MGVINGWEITFMLKVVSQIQKADLLELRSLVVLNCCSYITKLFTLSIFFRNN